MDASQLSAQLQQLQYLDPANPGSWPALVKGLAAVLLLIAGVGAAIYFDAKPQWEQLQQEERKEGDLKKTFESKQQKAANLDAYKEQLAQIEGLFSGMLRQLPSKTEVDNLLDDITRAGLASGLEFKLFKPGGEGRREFYAELPISLSVSGSFHEFGAFASGIAALPRIVTLHNISISGGGDSLSMEAEAKTYRYFEEGEG